VQAAFEVRRIQSSSGTRLLIAPSAQDAKIQFHAAPGSGLSANDENTLAAEVRNFLRAGLNLLPVDLPPDFPFTDFKGLGSGSSQVIALPFQLSGKAAPASGAQPLTQSFIGSSGFAVGVSSDYVTAPAPTGPIDIKTIQDTITQTPVPISIGWGWFSRTAIYHL